MTTGAAQTLARAYRVAPGERVVIAGNGPLNLQIARELLAGGAKVVAVLEAAPRPGARALAELLAGRAAPTRRCWAAACAAAAPAAQPLLPGASAVTRLEGERPRARASRPAATSASRPTRGLGYGFAPRPSWRASLGCAHRFVPRGSGSLATVTDARWPHQPARRLRRRRRRAPGRLARRWRGATLAGRDLRAISACRRRAGRGAQRTLRRAERFQQALWRLFQAPPFEPAAIADDTHRLPLRGDHGGRAARPDPRRPRHAGRAQAQHAASAWAAARAAIARRPLARLCTSDRASAEFDQFAPRPPAKPVPAGALGFEKPEWSGHKRAVPPDLARPREHAPLPPETHRRAGDRRRRAGSCLGYCLAREGSDVMVVDRDDINLQASGANAGSLHVQLLSFDFGAEAPQAAARPRPRCRSGPMSVRAVAGDRARLRRGPRDQDHRRPDGGRQRAGMRFLEAKAALERSHGIDAQVIDGNELRALAPCSATLLGAELCPGEGKINPLRAPTPWWRAAGSRARASCAAATCRRSSAPGDGAGLVTTSRGEIRAGRIVNAAGPGRARIGAMLGREASR